MALLSLPLYLLNFLPVFLTLHSYFSTSNNSSSNYFILLMGIIIPKPSIYVELESN